MPALNRRSTLFIWLVAGLGLAAGAGAVTHWKSENPARFLAYLAVALVASTLKVKLPGVTGTMSVNFLFVLIGVVTLTLPETVVMGCAAVLLQLLWHSRMRFSPMHTLFNVGSMATAVVVTHGFYGHFTRAELPIRQPLLLMAAACLYFVMNTAPVAEAIALTEGKKLRAVWKECYLWSLPFYLVGAAVVGLFLSPGVRLEWDSVLLILPVIFLIYRSYDVYLGRLEAEKKHVEEMAALHLRTIEALALAIDAKDDTTHEHLQRVQVYAVAIGRDLGLSELELEALRAASLLHDIGKLAVPEHIISKPGRLTPAEFEKMKIHPVVGAEILARVNFPYPVVPIVRCHHEKWNGSGYPDGLKGEEIPIGARILAAVDCLDALASDRQYRRALPLDAAMAHVAAEAGKSFDPKVVELLQKQYVVLRDEALARPQEERSRLSYLKVERGEAPAAGFEAAGPPPRKPEDSRDFLASIAAAREEFQMLFELTHELGNSLSLDETLSVLAVRLKRMVPYDSIAIYLRKEQTLVPAYVNGEDFRLLSSLEIPLGQGLSGWVAENELPIVNGNPSVEPGYLNDAERFSVLQSALAAPLRGIERVIGVLALYRCQRDAFNADHLRIVQAISSKLALAVENSVRFRQAESNAITDALTGLPNARSLFLHLDAEIARSQRQARPLTVLVCDLDGFKQINDRHGHLEGNQVLRTVAERLRERCREYDYVARMGGDEFVFVLPEFPAAALEGRVVELGAVAQQAGLDVCGADALGLSVGAAHYPQDGVDAEQLLAAADLEMYKAKAGRNRSAAQGPKSLLALEAALSERTSIPSSLPR